MKKLILILALSAVTFTLSGQVYKMDQVWKSGEQYLLCKKDMETGERTMVLCDVKYYDEKQITNPFISIYFEGSLSDTAEFFDSIVVFLDRYGDQDGVMTEILGRRVIRINKTLGAGVYIFEDDGRHFGGYRDKDITRMRKSFTDYCQKENIRID